MLCIQFPVRGLPTLAQVVLCFACRDWRHSCQIVNMQLQQVSQVAVLGLPRGLDQSTRSYVARRECEEYDIYEESQNTHI